MQASTNTTAFALGGAAVYAPGTAAIGHTGMASYDLATAQWHNTSTINPTYGANGWGAYGEAVYVPSYGEQGILVFLGGYAPLTQSFVWSSAEMRGHWQSADGRGGRRQHEYHCRWQHSRPMA